MDVLKVKPILRLRDVVVRTDHVNQSVPGRSRTYSDWSAFDAALGGTAIG